MNTNTLKNTLDVLGHLKRSGYKIGKSKLYSDVKAGMLPASACTVEDADKYARRARLKRTAEIFTGDLDRLSKEKSELEIRKLKSQNEQLEFDLAKSKGFYLPRDQFEQELSARAAVFLHGLRHLSQSRANEMLEIGKEKGPQAMADRLQADIEDLLNDYANRETFQVIVLPEADATSP